MSINPYRPGAGMEPQYLAGRESDINNINKVLEAISLGFPARSVVYYGLRGVGKTVLLNKVKSLARQKNIPIERLEIIESKSVFNQQITLCIFKLINKLSVKSKITNFIKDALGLLKAFSIKYKCNDFDIEVAPIKGVSDTGILSNDITELFTALGEIAQQQNKGVVITIDEIQYIKDFEFEALMEAIHIVNQQGFPIVIFAAGLPKIAKIAGDIKSYAERLFEFIEIDSLDKQSATLALTEPAKRLNIEFSPDSIDYIFDITQGYPYFLQEYGKWIWEQDENLTFVDLDITKKAYNDFINSLDKSFFKVRNDRATQREIEFMVAMASVNKLPCSTKDVAKIMNEPIQRISPIRAQLIHKGFIYSIKRGEINFTVPQFDKYLKRTYDLYFKLCSIS